MNEVGYFIVHEPSGMGLSDYGRDAWTLARYAWVHWFTRTDAEIAREKLVALHPEIEGYEAQLKVHGLRVAEHGRGAAKEENK